MSIGEAVKKVRLFKKITQKELASKIGISPNTLYRYEHGDISLSIEMLNKIANALNVSTDILLVDPSEIPDRSHKKINFNSTPISNESIPDKKQIAISLKILQDQFRDLQGTLEKYYSQLNILGQIEVNNYVEYLSTKEEYTKSEED